MLLGTPFRSRLPPSLPPIIRHPLHPYPLSAPQVLAEEEGKLGIPVTFAIDSDNPLMCAQVGG